MNVVGVSVDGTVIVAAAAAAANVSDAALLHEPIGTVGGGHDGGCEEHEGVVFVVFVHTHRLT